MQATIKWGKRHSTVKAFLRRVMHWPNIDVATESVVHKVSRDGRCTSRTGLLSIHALLDTCDLSLPGFIRRQEGKWCNVQARWKGQHRQGTQGSAPSCWNCCHC